MKDKYLKLGTLGTKIKFIEKYDKIAEKPEFVKGFETATEILYLSDIEQEKIKKKHGSLYGAIDAKSRKFKKNNTKEASDRFDLGCSIACLVLNLHDLWGDIEKTDTIKETKDSMAAFIAGYASISKEIPQNPNDIIKIFDMHKKNTG